MRKTILAILGLLLLIAPSISRGAYIGYDASMVTPKEASTGELIPIYVAIFNYGMPSDVVTVSLASDPLFRLERIDGSAPQQIDLAAGTITTTLAAGQPQMFTAWYRAQAACARTLTHVRVRIGGQWHESETIALNGPECVYLPIIQR